MIHRITLLGLAVCVALTAIGCATKPTYFGEAMKREKDKAITVKELLTHTHKYNGKEVCVTGVVTVVCPGAGCWLELADELGGETIFVQLAYDRSKWRVPPEAKGHKARVEGSVLVAQHTEAQRRHYAEEKGLSAEEIAQIKGPKPVVQVISPALWIRGVKAAAPQACPDAKE